MKSQTNNPHRAAKAIKPRLQPLLNKCQMCCQVKFHLMNKGNNKCRELAKNKTEKLKKYIFCMIEKTPSLFLSTFFLDLQRKRKRQQVWGRCEKYKKRMLKESH